MLRCQARKLFLLFIVCFDAAFHLLSFLSLSFYLFLFLLLLVIIAIQLFSVLNSLLSLSFPFLIHTLSRPNKKTLITFRAVTTTTALVFLFFTFPNVLFFSFLSHLVLDSFILKVGTTREECFIQICQADQSWSPSIMQVVLHEGSCNILIVDCVFYLFSNILFPSFAHEHFSPCK